jgi:hypothetical protein
MADHCHQREVAEAEVALAALDSQMNPMAYEMALVALHIQELVPELAEASHAACDMDLFCILCCSAIGDTNSTCPRWLCVYYGSAPGHKPSRFPMLGTNSFQEVGSLYVIHRLRLRCCTT